MVSGGSVRETCLVCGRSEAIELPSPHGARSMLSDGRIVARPLRKVTCVDCGTTRHASMPDAAAIRAFYDGAYDLGLAVGQDDLRRAGRYARSVVEAIGEHHVGRALEVGCGAGHVMAALKEHWPSAAFLGIDAAPGLANRERPSARPFDVRECFVEDLPPPVQGFDLVYAINVIEHAADPSAFLGCLVRQLADDGRLVLIFPAADPPNLELLFLDHLHTFTPASLGTMARRCGLAIVGAAGLGDFQMLVLAPLRGRAGGARAASVADGHSPDPAATARRAAYLGAWATLDRVLLERTARSPRLAVFGAGEVAALLRAYAPSTWSRVEAVSVDDPAGARALGPEVVRYAGTGALAVDAFVVATHPRSQAAVAARLSGDGYGVVRFDDLVER